MDKQAKAPPEKVASLRVAREKGYLYFLRGNDVMRQRLAGRRPDPSAPAELVRADAFVRESGHWFYFIDAEGDLARVSRVPGPPKGRPLGSRRKGRTKVPPSAKAPPRPSAGPGAELLRIEVAGFLVIVHAPPPVARARR